MKDGLLSKLTITVGGQQAIQYKKVIDALPVFYANKGYRYINNIIHTDTELVEKDFLPKYPDSTKWSKSYHI